jgi:hypothetical protein
LIILGSFRGNSITFIFTFIFASQIWGGGRILADDLTSTAIDNNQLNLLPLKSLQSTKKSCPFLIDILWRIGTIFFCAEKNLSFPCMSKESKYTFFNGQTVKLFLQMCRHRLKIRIEHHMLLNNLFPKLELGGLETL